MRIIALLVSFAFLPVCVACQPRELDVTTTTDGEPGSLRSAISDANARPGGDVRIELPAGTYELTRCGSDDDNAAGDLDVAGPVRVTIEASEPNVVIRQTCEGERALDGHGSGRL